MTNKIYCDEIPDDISTEKYIYRKTNTWGKWLEIKNQLNYKKLELKIDNYDHELLKRDTLSALDIFKFRGWNSDTGQSTVYGGLSLVSNPYLQDDVDPESSTLGATKNSRSEYFYNHTSNYKKLKNSYFDTYGFTEKTAIYNYGYIKEFLDSKFQRTIIRSRLAVMKPHKPTLQLSELQWHRDEYICQNLRINIPISTSPEYGFEMLNEKVYHLEEGKAYTWDTNIPHRVLLTDNTTADRIHFVIGISPWFDYDKDNRCWIQNEYWGKHPFQMLMDGEILSDVKILKAE